MHFAIDINQPQLLTTPRSLVIKRKKKSQEINILKLKKKKKI